jgi:Flp pilus assembly protein TadG
MIFAATLIHRCPGRPRQHAQRGAAALEFALIAPFFIFFISVVFDLGLTLFTQTLLNNAARDAARLIETNQSGGSAAFATKLCNDMEGMVPCGSLQYYVQSANSFAAMNASVQTSGGNLKFNGTFSPGSPGQEVVVQVAYNRPTIIPWAVPYLNGPDVVISNASNLLVSTVSFQNEP